MGLLVGAADTVRSVTAGTGEAATSLIARSIFRRCPRETPSRSKSLSVSSLSTSTSMSFSAKRCAYSDMPSASSQCARSCIAPHPQRRSLAPLRQDIRPARRRERSRDTSGQAPLARHNLKPLSRLFSAASRSRDCAKLSPARRPGVRPLFRMRRLSRRITVNIPKHCTCCYFSWALFRANQRARNRFKARSDFGAAH